MKASSVSPFVVAVAVAAFALRFVLVVADLLLHCRGPPCPPYTPPISVALPTVSLLETAQQHATGGACGPSESPPAHGTTSGHATFADLAVVCSPVVLRGVGSGCKSEQTQSNKNQAR